MLCSFLFLGVYLPYSHHIRVNKLQISTPEGCFKRHKTYSCNNWLNIHGVCVLRSPWNVKAKFDRWLGSNAAEPIDIFYSDKNIKTYIIVWLQNFRDFMRHFMQFYETFLCDFNMRHCCTMFHCVWQSFGKSHGGQAWNPVVYIILKLSRATEASQIFCF